MSGGSWNYLCYKDAVELLDRMDDLEAMRDQLREYGFVHAARHVVTLGEKLNELDMLTHEIQRGLDVGLSGVFKAVEWYDSGDITSESMEETIKEYEANWV